MTLTECFSDQYRTRDGREFFLFHFQRTESGSWFFSFSRSPSPSPIPGADFEVPNIQFDGETLASLRDQAARFAEQKHAVTKPDFESHYHITQN